MRKLPEANYNTFMDFENFDAKNFIFSIFFKLYQVTKSTPQSFWTPEGYFSRRVLLPKTTCAKGYFFQKILMPKTTCAEDECDFSRCHSKCSTVTSKKVFGWKMTFSSIFIRIFWELDTLKNSLFSTFSWISLDLRVVRLWFFRRRVELCQEKLLDTFNIFIRLLKNFLEWFLTTFSVEKTHFHTLSSEYSKSWIP